LGEVPSGAVSSTGELLSLEVPVSSASPLFLLFLGETAEGGEWADWEASDAVSLSEEAADL
jgi:hypothetical protein